MVNLYLPNQFDDKGDLLNENIKAEIDRLVLALAAWTEKMM